VEPDDAEWVNVAHDLVTWPDTSDSPPADAWWGAGRARKLYSPAVLTDQCDRDVLREMAAPGFRVRVTAVLALWGTAFIAGRTMILADPDSFRAGDRVRNYVMIAEPVLVSGVLAL
jgi:hypothetical protein